LCGAQTVTLALSFADSMVFWHCGGLVNGRFKLAGPQKVTRQLEDTLAARPATIPAHLALEIKAIVPNYRD
jgi:hypothetical protein